MVAEGGKVNLSGVKLTLTRSSAFLGVPDVRSDANGRSTFTQLVPGHHSLAVNPSTLPQGYFVQTVKLGGQEVSPDDFEILASGPLETVLCSTAGAVTGTVADEKV